MRKILKRNLRLWLLILVLSLLVGDLSGAYAQSETNVFIADLDCEAFPDITLLLRAVDSDGNLIPALSASGFSLHENGDPVDNLVIREPETGPKYVVFSIDLGRDSNYNNSDIDRSVRAAMRQFAEDFFTDGKDTAEIVLHINRGNQRTEIHMPPTQDQDELFDAIADLDLSRRSSEQLNDFQGLRSVYNDLVNQDPERMNTWVVHISRYVEGSRLQSAKNAEAESLGAQMAAGGVKVVVMQTDSSGETSVAEPFLKLVSENGGQYVDLSPRGSTSAVTRAFQTINRTSEMFRIQFRSRSAGPDHTLTVGGPGSGPGAATDSRSCAVALEPPLVTIISPEPGVFETLPAGVTTKTVTAEISGWPDGHPRALQEALLYVDGAPINPPIVPEVEGAPFIFQLVIDDAVGQHPYLLQVRVKDEYGIIGSSPVVDAIFEIPADPSETSDRRGSAGTSLPDTPTVCETNPFSLQCVQEWVVAYLPWVITGFVFLVLIIVLFNMRRQLANLSAPAREVISRGVDQIRKTLLGGTTSRQTPIAHLHVLMARQDRMGGKIDIFNNRTTIGRDPSVTDVQVYLVEDESSVSSLHCTIFYDQGRFFITDDNSTNGTFVNSKRLNANDPHPLQDGDEILLGDVFRQGAKLRFAIAENLPEDDGKQVSYSELQDDYNVDLYDQTEAGAPYEPASGRDALSETVPGFRDDDFDEPLLDEPPDAPKKSKDKSWMDDL